MSKGVVIGIVVVVIVVGIGAVWHFSGTKASPSAPTASAAQAVSLDPKASFEETTRKFVDAMKGETKSYGYKYGEPKIDVRKSDSLMSPYVGVIEMTIDAISHTYDCTFELGFDGKKWSMSRAAAIEYIPSLPDAPKSRVDLLTDPIPLGVKSAKEKCGL